MTGTKMKPEEWLTTDRAAKRLGVQRRELQRKAVAYPLQLRRQSRMIGGTRNTVYHGGDLNDLKQRIRSGHDLAAVEYLKAKMLADGTLDIPGAFELELTKALDRGQRHKTPQEESPDSAPTSAIESPSGWVPTAQAGQILECSRGELLRKASRYPLQLRKRMEPGMKHALYHRGDLAAFKERAAEGPDASVMERRLAKVSRLVDSGEWDEWDENGIERVSKNALERVQTDREAPTPQNSPSVATRDAGAALVAALESLAQRLPPPIAEPKPWMSIKEAAQYLHMPVLFIREQIAIDKLPYRDVSQSGAQRIRVRRRDLDAL